MSNNNDFIGVNTGGMTARYKRDEISVQVPQKTTGDIKKELPDPKGLAKASPSFKEIEAEKLSEEEKKKAIAKNLTKIKKQPEEIKEPNKDDSSSS